MRKALNVKEEITNLQPSGVDFVTLWAACSIPLFLSGNSVQQPLIGLFFVALSAIGLLVSYLIRLALPNIGKSKFLGWLIALVAIFVLLNTPQLSKALPGGGFPPELRVLSFLCWFVAFSLFFVWSDGAMLFMVVPGIALFGLLSWLETGGYFDISLILFIASVAVLLARLHIRMMLSQALSAGAKSFEELRAGPWKAMAGPGVAILSVLLVAGVSWIMSPAIGGAVRAVTGAPQVQWTPPTTTVGSNLTYVDQFIGGGPRTSSYIPVLEVTTDTDYPYLRAHSFRSYRGVGWTESTSFSEGIPPQNESPHSQLENAGVFRIPPPRFPVKDAITDKLHIKVLARTHLIAYSTGIPIRVEYRGTVRFVNNEAVFVTPRLYQGREVYVESIRAKPTPTQLRQATKIDRQEYINLFRERLNDQIDPRIRDWAKGVIEHSPTDYDAVVALMYAIGKRCKYNLRAPRITGNQDRVAAFLFETREGYCDLFASALAVACRAVGIPARVVVGYRLDPESMQDGKYIVQDRHAHMWTEVFFHPYGWIPFDPTDIAEPVPGGERGAIIDSGGENATLQWATWAAGILFGLVFLTILWVSTSTWIKTRRTLSKSFRKLRPLYFSFLAKLRKSVGRPPSPSETLSEYVNTYTMHSSNGHLAKEIAEKFNQAFFAQEEPSEEQIREIALALREFSTQTVTNGE
ncbi:MAG TPA: transglutaminase domain-containing protein [Fimbriimonadales bacterium]|nr:transglutaminase domain-containing protein [Fimbriimonadales bacterium]